MRILHVIPAFYPAQGYGGGPLVAYEMAKRLAERGHQVVVWTTDAADSVTRYHAGKETINGFERRRFKNISNSLATRHKIFLSPGILIAALRTTRHFDIVHLHDTRTFQNLVIAGTALVGGVPYVIQPHGTLSSKSTQKGVLKSVFDLTAGRTLISKAARLLALNETEADSARTHGAERWKTEVLPNGIDLSRYEDLPKKGVFRSLFGIEDSVRLVLYVGRVHESKGLDLLVKAFKRLRTDMKNVKLVVVGPDDGYREHLVEELREVNLENEVLITGHVDEHVKMAAYVDAEIFVTPRFFGFPLTFLEAMRCGVPIVTTDSGDVIRSIDGKMGYVVRADDGALAEVLARLLTDKEGRLALAAEARRMVSEYDWESIVDRLEQIYADVVRASQ